MPDRAFTEPRLAELYDAFDADRSDLVAYLQLLADLGTRSVLDVGCGTGVFALLCRAQGIDVIGIDPAGASLDVAKRKPGADQVTWIHGDIADVPALQVDAVTMTANVAQVFLDDEEWNAVLRTAYNSLRPGGVVIFETRDPDARGWEMWDRKQTYQRIVLADLGPVQSWIDLIEVTDDTVSFRGTCHFESSGDTLTSESTLRFRSRFDIVAALRDAGFSPPEIRGAPDRPGLEFVFVAHRD